MIRESVLKVVLVLEGTLFLAAVYPIATNIWNKSMDGYMMMLSIYFALGIFLLIAASNPAAHRSLVAFGGWANIAHALVMGVMAIRLANDRIFLLEMAGFCVLVGIPLIVLTPARRRISPNVAVATAR